MKSVSFCVNLNSEFRAKFSAYSQTKIPQSIPFSCWGMFFSRVMLIFVQSMLINWKLYSYAIYSLKVRIQYICFDCLYSYVSILILFLIKKTVKKIP